MHDRMAVSNKERQRGTTAKTSAVLLHSPWVVVCLAYCLIGQRHQKSVVALPRVVFLRSRSLYQGRFCSMIWCMFQLKVAFWDKMRITISNMYIWLGGPPDVVYSIWSIGSRTTSMFLHNTQPQEDFTWLLECFCLSHQHRSISEAVTPFGQYSVNSMNPFLSMQALFTGTEGQRLGQHSQVLRSLTFVSPQS